jgi:hypothetical protein
VVILSVAGATACGRNDRLFAYVGKAMLPECDGVIAAPSGEDVILLPSDTQTIIPTAPVIRIAADRFVAWNKVRDVARQVEAQGSQPVFLVGVNNKIRAFELSEELSGELAIRVTATADGKACVQRPGSELASCVQSVSGQHIERASVREFVEEAMKETGLTEVEVAAEATLGWADVVRTIDGARTCCGKGHPMKVKLLNK